MAYKHTFLTLALAASVVGSAMAQDKDERLYPFVGAQGGVQTTFTNYGIDKLLTSTVGIQFGQFHTPLFGTRLSVNGWRGKTASKALDKTYGYNYVRGNIDLLFNLSNAISPRKYHKFNAILLAGAGVYWADYNSKTAELKEPTSEGSYTFRGGVIFDYDITHNISLSLEVTANALDDRFNIKRNDKLDWQGVALFGLAYKFRAKSDKSTASSLAAQQDYDALRAAEQARAEAEAEARRKAEAAAAAAAKEAEARAAAARAAEPKQAVQNVFFGLNETEVSEASLANVIAYLKKHPESRVTVTGYADKGTGTPAINMQVSKKRAEAAAATLRKSGIEASRIDVVAKGDTEQPFAENEKNRVVISLAK